MAPSENEHHGRDGQSDFEATPCLCGGPMSTNPHPEAGAPGHRLLEVGAQYVCIPCTVRSRHRWSVRATRAEQQVAEAERAREWMDAIIVRIDEGDPRHDWLPDLRRFANEALSHLPVVDEPATEEVPA